MITYFKPVNENFTGRNYEKNFFSGHTKYTVRSKSGVREARWFGDTFLSLSKRLPSNSPSRQSANEIR